MGTLDPGKSSKEVQGARRSHLRRRSFGDEGWTVQG